MAKQALCKRSAETLDNDLISVNFSAVVANVCFVVFHFFRHASHELAARVNLQQLRQSQRTAPVNWLESLRNIGRVFQGQGLRFFVTAGNVDNSQCIFVNLSSMRKLVMGQKKKVSLVDRVRCRHIKFRARNVSQHRKIDLPDFGEFGIHLLIRQKSSKKTKSCVSKREYATTNKKKLTLFLQLTQLIHVWEFRLCGLS